LVNALDPVSNEARFADADVGIVAGKVLHIFARGVHTAHGRPKAAIGPFLAVFNMLSCSVQLPGHTLVDTDIPEGPLLGLLILLVPSFARDGVWNWAKPTIGGAP